jgi:vacuolar-type H+-ATPase subunit H
LKKQVEIIQEANKKADKILNDANNSAKVLSTELEKNFIESVKKTSKVVVKKLLQKDMDLQKTYLEEIVKEAI